MGGACSSGHHDSHVMASKPEAYNQMRSLISDTALRRMGIVHRRNRVAKPDSETFIGAVAFCDISGFTRFIESGNCEQRTSAINVILGRVVQLAYLCCGDVLKFAGDALIVLFQDPGLQEHQLAERAVAFAIKLLELTNVSDSPLGMHIGVGVGNVISLHVGGYANRWEHLCAGEVFRQVKCVALASRGEVCVSAEAWRHLSAVADGRHTQDMKSVTIHRLKPCDETRSIFSITLADLNHAGVADAPRELWHCIEYYSPNPIVSLIKNGHEEFHSELRRVSVLFISLESLDIHDLLRLNKVVNIIFEQLTLFEGTLRQLIIDDKGTVAILCFGLRPAHSDDPQRGVQAALNIQDNLLGMGIVSSIGITTGRTFSGLVGNNRRAEYACVGASVNKAARLMGLAKGRILVDESTQLSANNAISFQEPESVRLKGISNPVKVYAPNAEKDAIAVTLPTDNSASCVMWGREAEMAQVAEWVEQQSRTGANGLAIIESDTGMGKSLILQRIVAKAKDAGQFVIQVASSSIHSMSPYSICSDIFLHLMGVLDSCDSVDMSETSMMKGLLVALRKHVEGMGAVAADHWPLLEDVFQFPSRLRPTTFSKQLTGMARTTATRVFLVNILEEATRTRPLLLVVDNLDCLDTPSWLFIVDVANFVRNVVIVAGADSAVDKRLVDYHHVVQEHWVMRVRLQRLQPDDIGHIVCDYLQADMLDPQLQRVIVRAAGGNPYLAMETAKLFRLRNDLTIKDGMAMFRAAPHNSGRGLSIADERPDSLNTPELADSGRQELLFASVGSVLQAKMDLLNVREQNILKVASVIGQRFHQKCLLAALPGADSSSMDSNTMRYHISKLVKAGIIQKLHKQRYSFCGSLMHDFVYNSIPQSLRRKVHLATAKWLRDHPTYAGFSHWEARYDALRTPMPQSTPHALRGHERSMSNGSLTTPTLEMVGTEHLGMGSPMLAGLTVSAGPPGVLNGSGATQASSHSSGLAHPFDSNPLLNGTGSGSGSGTGSGSGAAMTTPHGTAAAGAGIGAGAGLPFNVPPLGTPSSADAQHMLLATARSNRASGASVYTAGVSDASGGMTPMEHNPSDSASVLALLVYHFLRGDDLQSALDCAERLGFGAFESCAYSEAIRSFRKALDIDDDLAFHVPDLLADGGPSALAKMAGSGRPRRSMVDNKALGISVTEHNLKRARWLARIGISYVELGNRSKAKQWLERALSNLGMDTVLTATNGTFLNLAALPFAMYMDQHAMDRSLVKETLFNMLDKVVAEENDTTSSTSSGTPLGRPPIKVRHDRLHAMSSHASLLRVSPYSHGGAGTHSLADSVAHRATSMSAMTEAIEELQAHEGATTEDEWRTHSYSFAPVPSIREDAEYEDEPSLRAIDSATSMKVVDRDAVWRHTQALMSEQHAVDEDERAYYFEVVQVCWPLLELATLSDDIVLASFLVGFLQYSMLKLASDSAVRTAPLWCMHATLLNSIGDRYVARLFMQRGFQLSATMPGSHFHAYCLRILATQHMMACHWTRCMSRAADLFDACADTASEIGCQQMIALQQFLRGKFSLCLRTCRKRMQVAAHFRDSQLTQRYRAIMACTHLLLGGYPECSTQLSKLGSLDDLKVDAAGYTLTLSCRGCLALQQGRPGQAEADLMEALDMLVSVSIATPLWIPAAIIVCLSYMQLLAQHYPDSSSSTETRRSPGTPAGNQDSYSVSLLYQGPMRATQSATAAFNWPSSPSSQRARAMAAVASHAEAVADAPAGAGAGAAELAANGIHGKSGNSFTSQHSSSQHSTGSLRDQMAGAGVPAGDARGAALGFFTGKPASFNDADILGVYEVVEDDVSDNGSVSPGSVTAPLPDVVSMAHAPSTSPVRAATFHAAAAAAGQPDYSMADATTTPSEGGTGTSAACEDVTFQLATAFRAPPILVFEEQRLKLPPGAATGKFMSLHATVCRLMQWMATASRSTYMMYPWFQLFNGMYLAITTGVDSEPAADAWRSAAEQAKQLKLWHLEALATGELAKTRKGRHLTKEATLLFAKLHHNG